MTYTFIEYYPEEASFQAYRDQFPFEIELLIEHIREAMGVSKWSHSLLNHQAGFYVDYILMIALNSEQWLGYTIDNLFDEVTFENIKRLVNENQAAFSQYTTKHFNNPTTALNHYVHCYRKLESQFQVRVDK